MNISKEESRQRAKHRATQALLSVSALALAAPAFAQDEPGVSASERRDVVVVTAQKREQTLNETPVAVSVVDAQTIERAEILDILDLQSVVPGLELNQGGNTGRTQYVIRGFGGSGGTPGIEPSVSVFIDGVYRTRAQAAIADLPNVERIEVLRGPQSTLFGKNASAGVISVVTSEASFTPEGYIEGGISNFDGYRGKAYFTGPLTESLAFSLGGSFNQRGGTVTEETSGAEINDRNRYAINGELRFMPNEQLDVRILADFNRIDEVCCESEGGILIAGPTAAAIEALGVDLNLDDPFPRDPSLTFLPTSEIENAGASIHVEYDLGFATVTSITSQRSSTNAFQVDSDGTSGDFIGTNDRNEEFDTFTQEVRLTSTGDGRVDWLVGAFYLDETIDVDADFLYGSLQRAYNDALSGGFYTGSEALLGVPAGTFGAEGQGIIEAYDQDNQALSVFVNTDFHLTDPLTLTLGLNYTVDEKDVAVSSVSTDVFSGIELAAISPALAALEPFQFLRPVQQLPNEVEDGTSEDDQLTYTIRAAYEVSDRINVYASYATGFKASSWNFSFDSAPSPADVLALEAAGLAVPNLRPNGRVAGPEDSRVIELGMKADFDIVAFNLALFDQSLEDFQSIIVTADGAFFANAEERVTQGIELDAWLYPTDGLTLSLSATYLDPRFETFTNSTAGDISGQDDESVSNLRTSFAVDYDFALGSFDAFIRGDWQYESERSTNDPRFQDQVGEFGELHLVNLSGGVILPSELDVRLWARNLLDEQEVISVAPALGQAGTFTAVTNEPRTYGVTVRKSF